MDLIIENGEIVNSYSRFKADIGVENGKIACIADTINDPDCDNIVDADGKLVLPGAVDVHTHLSMLR